MPRNQYASLILLCIGLAFLTSHCATTTTSNAFIPSTLNASQQKEFREVAKEIPNPCVEESLSQYKTLEELLNAENTCHEAAILSDDIAFFLSKGVEKLKTQGIVKSEAKAMVSPIEFNTKNRPRLGNAAAPVEVVVFSDFQCPFCARAAASIHKVYEARPEAVSFVFKQMPLTSIHPYAAAAALVSVYAQSKDKFWEVHDKLFAEQADLGPEKITEILESMGADPDDLFDPIKGQAYGTVVIEDVEDAKKAGVEGTPSFYVNGVAIESGGNYERMIARIDAEIAAPPAASREAKEKARTKALENCPYPGHEEMYALLPANKRADLALYTNSVLCPCPGTASTLHDCTSDLSCEIGGDYVELLITRILENVSQDEILRELESKIQFERTKQFMP